MKILNFWILVIAIFLSINGFCCWSMDAPGIVLYMKDGSIYMVQPDGRGEKLLAEQGNAPALLSPDGKQVIYLVGNQIFHSNSLKDKGRMIYKGKEGDNLNLFTWLPDSGSFIFRKIKKDGKNIYLMINIGDNRIKEMGSFYETPMFSPDGKYMVYSTYQPGHEKSEVLGGELGEEGRYVFTGRMTNVLSWDKEKNVIYYSIDDKIYAYDITNRERQIIPLPFKNIFVVAFGFPSIIYYHLDQEKHEPGLQMYDPEDNEQTTLIEKKVAVYKVSHNQNREKFIVFVPQTQNNVMGEGELYLIETRTGKASRLTRDVGKRIFYEINMDNQWSPDGKYIIYEKVRLKHSQPKKIEIFIAGEGKDEKMVKIAKPLKDYASPTWGNLR